MPQSRQPHCELGEVANFAVDRDRAAVLLGYDLIAYRQAKPRTFAGRLSCEEWLKHLIAVLRWNANAIITHTNLDAFAELAGRDLQHRTKGAVAFEAAHSDGIESVTNEVEEDATHILRHNLDRSEISIEVELQRDLEILVL